MYVIKHWQFIVGVKYSNGQMGSGAARILPAP